MIKQLQNDLYLVQDERVIKNNSYILVNDNDCNWSIIWDKWNNSINQ